jgi:DNA invertase Pin-like site-specific DNA recombinase
MLIGYMRVSKSDGSQSIDLQRDALIVAGVDPAQIYEDRASGRLDVDAKQDVQRNSKRRISLLDPQSSAVLTRNKSLSVVTT